MTDAERNKELDEARAKEAYELWCRDQPESDDDQVETAKIAARLAREAAEARIAELEARIKELEARVERDTDEALERLTAPRNSDDGFWCVNCGCYSISRHPQDFRFQHRVRPMTEFRREALIDIQRYVDHLREAVEAKRINESSIYRLVEGYLDQPGYYPQERVQLLAELQARGFPHSRDALALWRFAEGAPR